MFNFLVSGNLEGESGQQYSFNGYLDEYVKIVHELFTICQL